VRKFEIYHVYAGSTHIGTFPVTKRVFKKMLQNGWFLVPKDVMKR
jgi:hypothetical protein